MNALEAEDAKFSLGSAVFLTLLMGPIVLMVLCSKVESVLGGKFTEQTLSWIILGFIALGSFIIGTIAAGFASELGKVNQAVKLHQFNLQASFDCHLQLKAELANEASLRVVELQGRLRSCQLEEEEAVQIELHLAEQEFKRLQAKFWTDARFIRSLGFEAPQKSFKESLARKDPDNHGTEREMLA